jgi:hypothetical protein
VDSSFSLSLADSLSELEALPSLRAVGSTLSPSCRLSEPEAGLDAYGQEAELEADSPTTRLTASFAKVALRPPPSDV